jgi:hypothetical protein
MILEGKKKNLTLSKVSPINGGGGQIIKPIKESQEESKIYIYIYILKSK